MALIIITLQDGNPDPLAPPGAAGVQVTVQAEPAMPDQPTTDLTAAQYLAGITIDTLRDAVANSNNNLSTNN